MKMKIKIELTEEQVNTILVALIEKFDLEVNYLSNNPKSEYYLSEMVKTKKTKDYVASCMVNGGF